MPVRPTCQWQTLKSTPDIFAPIDEEALTDEEIDILRRTFALLETTPAETVLRVQDALFKTLERKKK